MIWLSRHHLPRLSHGPGLLAAFIPPGGLLPEPPRRFGKSFFLLVSLLPFSRYIHLGNSALITTPDVLAMVLSYFRARTFVRTHVLDDTIHMPSFMYAHKHLGDDGRAAIFHGLDELVEAKLLCRAGSTFSLTEHGAARL